MFRILYINLSYAFLESRSAPTPNCNNRRIPFFVDIVRTAAALASTSKNAVSHGPIPFEHGSDPNIPIALDIHRNPDRRCPGGGDSPSKLHVRKPCRDYRTDVPVYLDGATTQRLDWKERSTFSCRPCGEVTYQEMARAQKISWCAPLGNGIAARTDNTRL
jgi:hypothetical protein